ncbi:hypothetical protein AB834_01190 [PVC group bacterium (ex Bugula neritina AB1)]|nr:hypothetical protein AB834_01190 [PVC group bacterium (ex Bugula neritina AB1)]
MIYLDNAATTQPSLSSCETYQKISQTNWGNPSSLHRLGAKANETIENARLKLASLWSIKPNNIIWTSGATEANQTVLLQVPNNPNPHKNRILVSPFEHPSVQNALPVLKERGFYIDYLDISKKGLIDENSLHKKLTPETSLVSIIGIHNEIGVKQDIPTLCKIIRKKSPTTAIHIDMVQWVNKYALPLGQYRPDFLTFSAHKCHGPKGVGGIIKLGDISFPPLLRGGDQEYGFRAGTENVAAIASAVQSFEEMQNNINLSFIQKAEKELFDFVQSHKSIIWLSPEPGPTKTPWISLISIPSHKSEVLLHCLEKNNIFVSSGSACSEKKRKSYSKNMKISYEEEQGILRISLSIRNQPSDITYLIQSLKGLL